MSGIGINRIKSGLLKPSPTALMLLFMLWFYPVNPVGIEMMLKKGVTEATPFVWI
jgi:hypothetical protein